MGVGVEIRERTKRQFKNVLQSQVLQLKCIILTKRVNNRHTLNPACFRKCFNFPTTWLYLASDQSTLKQKSSLLPQFTTPRARI